jgi:DNA helicase HerA-like ATPase
MIPYFDPEKFIGYVSKVSAELTRVHFPNSTLLKGFYYDGGFLTGGLVRNYVIIEGDGYGFLGRIVEIALPEKERFGLPEKTQSGFDLHPTGFIEIQCVFDICDPSKIDKGYKMYPSIGAKVFLCSEQTLRFFFEHLSDDSKKFDDLLENFCEVIGETHQSPIGISANALFSRHSAIVGTTGSGKSYSIGKIIEGLSEVENSKVILLDATGEFSNIKGVGITNAIFTEKDIPEQVFFPYEKLGFEDFVMLFRATGQSQAPKIQEALWSLRLSSLVTSKGEIAKLSDYGVSDTTPVITKGGKSKKAFRDLMNEHIHEIDNGGIDFNILYLPQQIREECIYESGFNDPSKWGDQNPKEKEYVSSLISRISTKIRRPATEKIFNLKKGIPVERNIVDIINIFLADNTKRILNINLAEVAFEEKMREILIDCIGRQLLILARKGTFNKMPTVVFLDEAHQFLNKKIKDDFFEIDLSSFASIAKECRKYGLFLCLSTQRPRDVPDDVLSQMGTLIAHRLINGYDREAIERASPEASKYLLKFLPSLGKGEALIVGTDFPMPLHVKISEIKFPDVFAPKSETPKLGKLRE